VTFPTQCPCGAELRVLHRGCRTWTAVCPDCYDGTEDSPSISRVMGHGDTAEQAVQDFHERRADAA
jgi:hypothetical protein